MNWTFVARDVGEGEEYPQLYFVIGFQLKFIQNINCSETPHPNVYECSVTPEPVEAGDFIGVSLPPLSNARLLLSFILNGAPPGESLLTGGNLLQGLPFITLGVGKSPLATLNYVTYPSTVPLPSSTQTPSSVVSIISSKLNTLFFHFIPQPATPSVINSKFSSSSTIISEHPSPPPPPTTGSYSSQLHQMMGLLLRMCLQETELEMELVISSLVWCLL